LKTKPLNLISGDSAYIKMFEHEQKAITTAVCGEERCLTHYAVTPMNDMVYDVDKGHWQILDIKVLHFNKTEAAVFTCRLWFLRAFPFISFLISFKIHVLCSWVKYATSTQLFFGLPFTASQYCFGKVFPV